MFDVVNLHRPYGACSFMFRLLTVAHHKTLPSQSRRTGEKPRHKGKTMRKLKLFGVAVALAGAAFVFTMLKDPPKSVASDPTATIQPNDIKISTGIPTGDYEAN